MAHLADDLLSDGPLLMSRATRLETCWPLSLQHAGHCGWFARVHVEPLILYRFRRTPALHLVVAENFQ